MQLHFPFGNQFLRLINGDVSTTPSHPDEMPNTALSEYLEPLAAEFSKDARARSQHPEAEPLEKKGITSHDAHTTALHRIRKLLKSK